MIEKNNAKTNNNNKTNNKTTRIMFKLSSNLTAATTELRHIFEKWCVLSCNLLVDSGYILSP